MAEENNNSSSNITNKTDVTSNMVAKTAIQGDSANHGKTVQPNDTSGSAPPLRNIASSSPSNQPSAPASPENKSPGIPDHLQPLVQQQLNALETSQMMWQGNIWPGQDLQLEVHEQASQNPGVEGQRQWVTQIQLDLPNLGVVAATLRLNSAGLSLSLNADSPQTRAALGNASTQLVSALSDAGIPVLNTKVTNVS
jgi:hypothetical protein